MGDVSTAPMYVFSGICCCNTLLTTDIMHFIGCSAMSECLCIHEEFCLRINVPPMPCVIGPTAGYICMIGLPCCALGLKVPTVLVKHKSTCFCITNNCALPPDADTPIMFAMLGCILYPMIGFCVHMGSVRCHQPC